MRKLILISAGLAAACSKSEPDATGDDKEAKTPAAKTPAPDAAPSCPALTFTVNGEARTGFVHGLAILHKSSSEEAYQVEMYNHTAVTCEQVLAKSGRQVKPGELDVRAFAGARFWGVGYKEHAQMATAPVKLIGAPPAKVGDPVTLCAEEHAFTRHDGTQVVIAGTFTGTYCGVMQF